MKLEPGDVIQVDGGSAIVTETKGDKALIASLNISPGRSSHALKNGIEPNVSNNRLLERRGAEGLAEFFQARNSETRRSNSGKLKVEPGDRLCYEGGLCTVIAVTEKGCEIIHPDGRRFKDDRWLNEFFFEDCTCHKLIRLNKEERAANLASLSFSEPATNEPKPVKTTKKKTTSSKPVASQPKPEKPSRNGALFGSSICRVAMTAGAAGVTYEQFSAVLKKHGLTISEATARQNLRLGKSGKMQGAVLTKQQLDEFTK